MQSLNSGKNEMKAAFKRDLLGPCCVLGDRLCALVDYTDTQNVILPAPELGG